MFYKQSVMLKNTHYVHYAASFTEISCSKDISKFHVLF